MKKIMGTGSRSMVTHPDAKIIYANLEAKILQIAEKEEVMLITGMAEGWDEAIAKVGMRNNIPYVAYVPNQGYGQYYWGKNSLLKVNRMPLYQDLLAHAMQVIFVCQTIYVNGVHANFIRNQAMVDACDMAMVYDSNSSGTRDAVARLKIANKPYLIYPFNLQEVLF